MISRTAAVVARSGGYLLQVAPDSVDALAVIHLAASAKESLAAGDLARSLAVGEQARAMYRVRSSPTPATATG